MHEFYDEIVFTNPSSEFFADLMKYTPPPPDKRPITHLTVLKYFLFFQLYFNYISIILLLGILLNI